MAETARPGPIAVVLTFFVLLATSCAHAGPPTPAFTRAEVVDTSAAAAPCADACKPRSGEQVESCHLGSLESALLARRETLGDRGVRRDAMVCLYRRDQP